MQDYYNNLLRQLPTWAARSGLEKAETEALTALVSTEMENPSPNIYQAMAMLTSGYEVLYLTMDSLPDVAEFQTLLLMGLPNVTLVYWEWRHGKRRRLVTRAPRVLVH